MKNKFSVLLLSACLAAAAFVATENVEAQNVQTILSGGTNNLAANTLVTYSLPVIAVQKGSIVGLQTQFKLVSGNGITNMTFKFDVSLDNAMWQSNAITWGVPPTAAVTNSVTTNISVGAWNFIRLNLGTNGNDTALTNLILKASQKSGF